MPRRTARITSVASVVAACMLAVSAPGNASPGRYNLGLGGPRTVARDWARYSGRLTIEGVAGVPDQRILISVDDDTWAFGGSTGPDGWFDIPVPFWETGPHRLQARTLGDGVTSRELTVTVVDGTEPATMIASVAGAFAYRLPASVEVMIGIEGQTDLGPGSVVTGTVRVGAGTPCWDWQIPCLDVEYEATHPFRSVTDHNGRYWASVGPFGFVADPAPIVPNCKRIGARVDASSGDREATDGAAMTPCV